MAAPTFLQVLAAEVARMQTLHPDREGELARASALILHGMVVPSPEDPATGQVLSSDAQTVYHVNGTCDCRAGACGTMCKHRQAWQLYQFIAGKVEAQPTVVQPSPETVETQPLYEAPASVHCHIMIDGRQVQLTLRDRDEGRLLARLQAVLKQYPAPQPMVEPASQGEGWCSKRGIQMKLHSNANGQWFSHYVDDKHCKGK
jgi:hypothetical protein